MVRLATRAHGWAALSRHRDQLAANVAHEQEIPDVARVGHRLGHLVVVGNVEDVWHPNSNAEPVVELAVDAAKLVAGLADLGAQLDAALEQADGLGVDQRPRRAANGRAPRPSHRLRSTRSRLAPKARGLPLLTSCCLRLRLLAVTVFHLPPPALDQGEHALDAPSLHVADRAGCLSDYATSHVQDGAEVRADHAQQSLLCRRRASLRLGRVLINRDCSAIAGCRKRRVRIALDDQAFFRRRRHQPRRPPQAKIRPGSPAPAMGPGTVEIAAQSVKGPTELTFGSIS